MAKILVVEDEIHIQRLTRIVLEKGGHTITCASSGEEALKSLESGDVPDLILLDIMMAGIDGLQVLRTLKQNPRTAKVSVIMLTAIAQEAVVLKGIQLGAKDYIRKPFHPSDLLDRINRLLMPLPKAEGA